MPPIDCSRSKTTKLLKPSCVFNLAERAIPATPHPIMMARGSSLEREDMISTVKKVQKGKRGENMERKEKKNERIDLRKLSTF